MTTINWIELYLISGLVMFLISIIWARYTSGMELGEFCLALSFCAVWPVGVPVLLIFFISQNSDKDWILTNKAIEAKKRSGYDS